jgi:response regulator NasT
VESDRRGAASAGGLAVTRELDARTRRLLLVTNGTAAHSAALTAAAAELGHEATVLDRLEAPDAAEVLAQARPDAAIVAVTEDADGQLAFVEAASAADVCPVLVSLPPAGTALAREAARRGAFACLVDTTPDALECALEIALHRARDYHDLRAAFHRRATIEQAKGILMERHGLSPDRAFDLLRRHSQRTGTKLAEIAAALTDSHILLPAVPAPLGGDTSD